MKVRLLPMGMLLAALPLIGCEVKTTNAPTAMKDTGAAKKDVHGDSHDHHDHPEHGANGGHVAHFDSNPTVHFEWAHDDDQNTLTVYFEELVSGGGKVEMVEVRVKSPDDEKKFSLAPDEKAKVKGSVFQAKDAELLTLVGASGKDPKGVQAKMVAVIDGKEETVLLIDEHDHH